MTTYFHYTSLNTFLQIIQNRSVRFTEIRRSNDSLEGTFFVQSFESLLSHLKYPEYFINACAHILNRFLNIYSYYGMCLTSEADDLSQWRAYGQNGRGVSIGFDLEKLYDCAKKTKLSIGTKSIEIRYGKEAILEWFEDLNSVFSELDIGSEKDWVDPEKIFIDKDPKFKNFVDALEIFSRHCFDVKNEVFRAEKETRIVQETVFTFSNGLRFYERNGRIIPYYDVEITPECIDVIVIGNDVQATSSEIYRVLTSWDPRFVDKKIYRSNSTLRV